jgi:alpha-tubulin suppressor-like RCC1 family protein
MPITRIQTQNIKEGAVTTEILSNTATAAFASSASVAEFASALAPKVSSVNVANSAFAVLDDTAVNTGGGYIVVTGTNFAEGATVLIDTTPASAVTRINSTTLRVQTPAKSAATYNLFVVNPDGGTGIKVSGITYSADPNWVTASPLSPWVRYQPFSVTLNATGATSYTVANGSTLPANTTLLANGHFYGNVSIESETTYSFVIVATDNELQDSSKTFGLTVSLTPPNRLWAWGSNNYGQHGTNNTTSRASPIQTSLEAWTAIGGGSEFMLGVRSNGTLWAWGRNDFGQLGQSNLNNYSSPVQIGTDTNWASVCDGPGFSAGAIKTTGTLWTWGCNHFGILGTSDVTHRSSPVQVGSRTDWTKIAFGCVQPSLNWTMAGGIAGGELLTWGWNGYRNLGHGGYVERSSPVQVSSGYRDLVIGLHNSAAIKTSDNTIWVWGYNPNKTNGLGAYGPTEQVNPQQMGSASWSSVTKDNHFTFGVRTNGTLWVWGGHVNATTEHGLGSNQQYVTLATQIGALTNWNKVSFSCLTIAAPRGQAVATKTNGTLWAWGTNDYSQTGGAGTTNSPAQLGALTSWNTPRTMMRSSFATYTG